MIDWVDFGFRVFSLMGFAIMAIKCLLDKPSAFQIAVIFGICYLGSIMSMINGVAR